jgi:hypothetical protein
MLMGGCVFLFPGGGQLQEVKEFGLPYLRAATLDYSRYWYRKFSSIILSLSETSAAPSFSCSRNELSHLFA